MTTQPLSLDDGLPAISKRLPVVQVQELPLCTPIREQGDEITYGVVEVVGKSVDGLDESSKIMLMGMGLKRPYSGGEHDGHRISRPEIRRRSSSIGSPEGVKMDHQDHDSQEQLFVRLHKTRSVDTAKSFEVKIEKDKQRASRRDLVRNGPLPSEQAALPSLLGPLPPRGWYHPSQFLGQALNGPCGIVAPLTPPDDLDSFKWESPFHTQFAEAIRTVPNVEQSRRQGQGQHNQTRTSSTSRPSEIQMPEPSDMAGGDSSRPNWLGRACQKLVSCLGNSSTQQQVQMVAQALPARPNSADMRQVMDKVVEDIQSQFTIPPYITITHAYFQAISMDEVPASPPATPNAQSSSSDDYFQDHTIFTHAATVPAYHFHSGAVHPGGPRPSNIIAAPSSIQISILERYIPPTTAREVEDFFTLSRRSYLADRLLELSSDDGSLLLIYPTKRGGQAFANRYIGPVIEPFLRQFILLNSLYTEIAMKLGRMAAVSGMKSFEEMTALLAAMCEALTQRAPARGLPSRYNIVHAETAEVVLDRSLWRDWYIEQEKPRLRQDLVDYHKSGGRMPSRSGQIEITPGMLAREVVDGIRQSREAAGDVGLEVGVFVIRRSTVV
ncbi:hypothetical protein G647_02368 [Cladophialophora carrionii CBS 160.54]|uniref:Uncharacterized protein n=1 Tax=Cladophialophora carrionii CBS 160.54 TaxID=1279043 RepID=V9DFC5_9EURO|nr:uncharacterized protein G647_02368 [Cladophialophora carrionii CBS 160.54]ETI25594.1 hypothetical protein G647_02368 [Cladophialophora carrionii CBS 160.54]